MIDNENGSHGSYGSQCSESTGYKFKTPFQNLKDFEYGNGSYDSQGSRLKRYSYILEFFQRMVQRVQSVHSVQPAYETSSKISFKDL